MIWDDEVKANESREEAAMQAQMELRIVCRHYMKDKCTQGDSCR